MSFIITRTIMFYMRCGHVSYFVCTFQHFERILRTHSEKVRKCELILSQTLQIAAQSPTTMLRVRDVISQDASQGITFEMLFKYSLNATDLLWFDHSQTEWV